MSRPLLLGLLIIFLLVGGLATFNALWLELAIPLAVYLLAGFLFARSSPEPLSGTSSISAT
jgi:hypothetical protein